MGLDFPELGANLSVIAKQKMQSDMGASYKFRILVSSPEAPDRPDTTPSQPYLHEKGRAGISFCNGR